MSTNKPLVSIVMGSDSDLPVMKLSAEMLEKFGIGYEMVISSAHRSPKMTLYYAHSLEKKGIQVIIVGAGGAAHLAGVIASHTVLPVIGVPMETSSLSGVDSLFSTVQMPKGIPVATMSIGKPGAVNAAILAAQIHSIKNPQIKNKLKKYKGNLAKEVTKKTNRLSKLGFRKYLKAKNK